MNILISHAMKGEKFTTSTIWKVGQAGNHEITSRYAA